ncbi:MAG: hypothetical protein WD042_17750 [Phycisphaeraceae bacterium]
MKARQNPFRVERVLQVRYQPQDDDWVTLLARLRSLHYRAAIVGPQGSGKTTLLDDVQPHLEQAGFDTVWLRLQQQQHRLDPEVLRPALAGATRRTVILFDGADHLHRWHWWRFLRQSRDAGGLIITSHKSGLLPTWLHTRTSPQLLGSILGQLLPAARLPTPATIESLYHRHHGNLRDALRELYDRAV